MLDGNFITGARESAQGERAGTGRGGTQSDHNPWCIETWVPPPHLPRRWDLGTYRLPHATDICWSSLWTCSNLFTWGPSPTGTGYLVVATETHTVGQQVVFILLEFFLLPPANKIWGKVIFYTYLSVFLFTGVRGCGDRGVWWKRSVVKGGVCVHGGVVDIARPRDRHLPTQRQTHTPR